jgi:hypothetical protein
MQHVPRSALSRVLVAAVAALVAGATFGAGTATAAGPARTIVYSVAADGAGSSCSPQAPCSLTTAQNRVRNSTNQAADIDVVLAGGTYRLGQPLTLDAAKGDTSTDGHTVTYGAAPGAHPVLSGGQQVTGWHQTAGRLWAANVPAGTDTRQLYIDGVRANRAAGPNPASFTRTATGYTMSNTTMDSWHNISDVQFVYDVGWTEMICGVASVSGTTVTMQQPCFDNSTKKPYGVNADSPGYVENAKELLTDPGQFYLDRTAHTLYYRPRANENLATADVEIPRLQTLVTGTGTEQNPLRDLTFQGISFEYGGWTAADGPDGFSEVQANMHLTGTDAWEKQGSCDRFSTTDPGTCPYGNWTMTPGNVVFDHASGLTIDSDTFTHLGAAGLQLGQDVSDSHVTGNVFTDISANGMEIGNGTDADPTDLTLIPTDNTVADNWVHNVAVEYTGGVGIFQGYARYDTIEHNQINDVPYSGISSNWGWGHTPTETAGNKILDNLVYDAMQQRGDGGGIYALGQQGDSLADGLLISGNVVRDDVNYGNAIYTDGGSEYLTETDNAAFGNDVNDFGGCREPAPTPYGGFSITGNYYDNLNPGWSCGNPDDSTITDNTQVGTDGTGVPAALLANAGLEPAYTHLAAAPTAKTPVNLALHKPVQAQYIDGSTAQLQPGSQLASATDGDPSTYVQATGQYRWQLVVDLQQPQTLGHLTVSMPQNRFATDFHVDASTDGTAWTTVSTVHNSGWGSDPIDFTTPITARYLRIVADEPSNGNQRGGQLAIDEVGAYAPADVATHSTAEYGGGRLGGPLAALAVDGSPNTVAPVGSGDQALVTDLGAVTDLGVVGVQQPRGISTPYSVAASTDGKSWTTVVADSRTAPAVLATPVAARYLRFSTLPGTRSLLLVGEVVAEGTSNAALNRPASALYVDNTQALMQPNSTAADAVDGDPGTFAQATQQYRWTEQVDLQRAQPVSIVSVLAPTDTFASAFHIDVSLDGSTWWTVGRRVDNAGGLTAVELDQPVTARYVRVIADRPDGGGQTGGQMAISELSVYGGQ